MKRMLSIVAVMMAILFLAACKKDNSSEIISSGNVPDPAGTVLVNVSGRVRITEYTWIATTDTGNFFSDVSSNDADYLLYYPHGEFVALGQANGLGNLNTSSVPTTGWSTECAIQSGYLYIIRRSWKNKDGQEKSDSYCGIYVVSWNGSVATIKYCAFEPGVGWK